MLIFIAKRHNGFTLIEQVNTAIQAGCGWIQASIKDFSELEINDSMDSIVNECREQGVILTIEDNIELAEKYGVHGVYISDADANARAVRERMGAEAIIGIEAKSASSVATLAAFDIDYVTLPDGMSIAQIAEFVSTVRNGGVSMPIVVVGGFARKNISELCDADISGFALCMEDIIALTDEADPINAIDDVLTTINNSKIGN